MKLLIIGHPIEVSLYRLKEAVGFPVIGCRLGIGLSFNRLHPIVDGFQIVGALVIKVKGHIRAGHPVQGLKRVFIIRGCLPREAFVSSAERCLVELIGNIGVVLRGDGSYSLIATK